MKHSQQFLHRRKLFMMLPLLVTPFLTMIFWSLGGGQGTPVQAKTLVIPGLNLSVPDAQFGTKEIWDKLSLYELAERDSAKYREARESDPYFDLIAFKTKDDDEQVDTNESKLLSQFRQKEKLAVDPNEEKVNKKLDEFYREINLASANPSEIKKSELATPVNAGFEPDPQFTQDVGRLEKMMESMKRTPEADPEMLAIDSMLEKVLDVQHPERVTEKLRSLDRKAKEKSLPVKVVGNDNEIALITSPVPELSSPGDSTVLVENYFQPQAPINGFYGLDEETLLQQQPDNAIEAVIHDDQKLVAGAVVKMRLLNDIRINERLIPRDQLIYGVCGIAGERLTIAIASVRTGNSLLPVSLNVYDLDGLEGIYIPGAISRDAAKQATDNGLQNMQLMSMDPSIGAQAAAAGVEAAKGLLSKKAKLIKVTVKAGYHILLKDTRPGNQ